MTIYLYVKTHNKTGLKYLGKTTNPDPHTYHGSGVDWKQHLKEHGIDYTTEIIKECYSNQELNEWGRYYSKLWNVAESSDWANRIPETGGGQCDTNAAKKISAKLKGRKKPPRTKEHTEKIANRLKGRPNPKTAEGLRNWYDSNPNRDATIEKQSKSLRQWYIDNPERSHNKAVKTWEGRYQKQYTEYKKAVELASLGFGVKTIQNQTGMCLQQSSINKLRSGDHPIYKLFPELKEHLSV